MRPAVPAPLLALRDAHQTLGTGRLLAVTPRWLVRPTFLVFLRNASLPSPLPANLLPVRWEEIDAQQIGVLQALNPQLRRAEVVRRWSHASLAAGQAQVRPGLRKCGARAATQSHDMAVQLAAFARSVR